MDIDRDGSTVGVRASWSELMGMELTGGAGGKRAIDAMVSAAWVATGLAGIPLSSDVTIDTVGLIIAYVGVAE